MKNGKQGFTLFAVMAMLTGIAIVAAAIYTLSSANLSIAGGTKKSAQAFRSADAGVQYMLARMKADLASGAIVLTNGPINVNYAAPTGMSFETIRRLPRLAAKHTYLGSVTGRWSEARSVIEVVVSCRYWEYLDFFSRDEIRMGGGGSATATLRSNGNITLLGGATVTGDARPGPSGWVNNPGSVTGSTAPSPDALTLDPVNPIDLAAALASNNNASISGAYLSGLDLTINSGGAVTLTSGVYYLRDVRINGGGTLTCAGDVTIYCIGEWAQNGGALVNSTANPDNLEIYCTSSTASHKFSGSSSIYGHIYAPNASSVELSGGCTFYGSVVSGGSLDVSSATLVGGYRQIKPAEALRLDSWREL